MSILTIIGIILLQIAFFILGYWFCLKREYVAETKEIVNVLNRVLSGEISHEEGLALLDKIKIP